MYHMCSYDFLCVIAKEVSIGGESTILLTLTIQTLFWGLIFPKQSNNIEIHFDLLNREIKFSREVCP